MQNIIYNIHNNARIYELWSLSIYTYENNSKRRSRSFSVFFCFLLFLYHANLYDMHRARNNSRVLQRRAFKLCTKSRSLQTLSNHKYKYKILKIISKLMMYIIRINCLEINIGNIHLLSPCLP